MHLKNSLGMTVKVLHKGKQLSLTEVVFNPRGTTPAVGDELVVRHDEWEVCHDEPQIVHLTTQLYVDCINGVYKIVTEDQATNSAIPFTKANAIVDTISQSVMLLERA